MATTLEIRYPEQLTFFVKAGTAKMVLNGIFPMLHIELEDGSIELNSSFSVGQMKTNTAHINVIGLQNSVFTQTKKGKVIGRNTIKEKATLLIESKRGNIFINSNRK